MTRGTSNRGRGRSSKATGTRSSSRRGKQNSSSAESTAAAIKQEFDDRTGTVETEFQVTSSRITIK